MEKLADSIERLADSTAKMATSIGNALTAVAKAVSSTSLAWGVFLVRNRRARRAMALASKGLFRGSRAASALTTAVRGAVAALAPFAAAIGVAVAGVLVLVAGIYALVKSIQVLARTAKVLDDVAKSARLAGQSIGEALGNRLLGELSGTGQAVDKLRNQYIELIRTARGGDLRSQALLQQMGIASDDMSDLLSDTERFERLLRRIGGTDLSTLTNAFGARGARELRELARSTSEVQQSLRELNVTTAGSERLRSAMSDTVALTRAAGMQFSGLFDGFRDQLASLLELINKGLLAMTRRFQQLRLALRGVSEGFFQGMGGGQGGGFLGDLFGAGQAIGALTGARGTPTDPFVMATSAIGGGTAERGGFSQVFRAMRADSYLQSIQNNTRRTAENTDPSNQAGSASGSTQEDNQQTNWSTTGLTGRLLFGVL